MNWFNQWFYRKVKYCWENKHEFEREEKMATAGNIPISRIEEDVSWGDGLRINVKRVNGGFVVTFRCYDRKTDRSDDRHYIITSEQDFNSELGKLITLESMRA